MNKILLVPTSYKFYWGGIADYKVLASNLALDDKKVLRTPQQNLYVPVAVILENRITNENS